MDFPIQDLMDETACYQYLLEVLHPEELRRPRCQAREGFQVHRSFREPVLDDRRPACGRVFNAWTGTVFQGTHDPPSVLVLIVRGFARGESTAQLARELRRSRKNLHKIRHQFQTRAQSGLDRSPLSDTEVEADEMDQNAGEKGVPHLDPDDPPRHRANKRRGHGTKANDRPPVVGVVGRQTGQVRLKVVEHADRTTLEELVGQATTPGTTVYTDEWSGYDHLPELNRNHSTVCHTPGQREWARDDDEVMGSGRSTTTRWKGPGPVFGISSESSGG